MAGQWMSIMNRLSDSTSFYWGHQGYEYVDLGRGWQVLLFAGLLIWFFLVVRAILPALRKRGEQRQLVWLFTLSAGAIGLFYGAGLTWGQHTHLSIIEYWRWWVVHLWVEGFFEVFATTVIAFFFARLELITPRLRGQGRLAFGDDLPRRRHYRHMPSPLLLRHADHSPHLGLGVQRSRGRSSHARSLLRA